MLTMVPITMLLILATVFLAEITLCHGAACTVGIEGPDAVLGYDGGLFTMPNEDKFLASTFVGTSHADQCKFRVRVSTHAVGGVVWMGVAFGVHDEEPTSYERKFRVSRSEGSVEVRGRDLEPTAVVGEGCYETATGAEDWTFCVSDNAGCWDITFGVATKGCEGTVTYCEPGQGDNTSDHDQVTIEVSDYYDGLLEGMCGNKDGDPANDPDCTAASKSDPDTCAA